MLPPFRQPGREAQLLAVAAQPCKAVDDVGPGHHDAGDVQPLVGVAVVVVQIKAGGIAEEAHSLIHPVQFGGEDGVDRRGQGGLVDRPRLVEFVVDALDLPCEGGVVQVQEHQHIRLLDHVAAVDAVVGPVAVQREFTDRDGADVRVGQIEVAIVLLDQACLILREVHVFRNVLPEGDFIILKGGFFRQHGIGGRLLAPHPCQHLCGIGERAHTHVIGVGVVVHHHVEFIRAHHAVVAVLAGSAARFDAAGHEAGNLQQHLRTAFPEEALILCQVHIVPDAVGHGSAGLKLQTGVLPQGAGLVAVQGGDGIARAPAVQHFGAPDGHGQRVVAELQQAAGCVRVGEQVEGQAAGLGVPEGMAVVGFTDQALRADVVAHAAAVVGLGQLEAAEADALLLGGDGI